MKRFYILSVALFLAFITNAQVVSTFVGTGTQGTSTSGTTRLSTNLDLPWGSAIDSKGNIWITTEGGHEIKMLQSSGNVYIRSGAYGFASFFNASGVTARFNSPRGIAVGPGDTLFIADYSNCAIRKMTPFLNLSNSQTISVLAGKYTTGSTAYTPQPGFADGGPKVAQFNGPTDVAVDNSGNVYVADADNHAIRKITRAGVVSTIAGGPTKKGYADGAVGVAKFDLPTGLFLDSNGDLYVADKGNSKIRKISNGQVTTVVSNLYLPIDLIYTSGVLYITDQYRIRKYANSTLSTFAGSNTLNDYGKVDGSDINARFNYVRSLFLSPVNGLIYVADQDNHLIRTITIALTPKCSFIADKTSVEQTKAVTFTDQSTNTPTSRKWTFTGGTPASSTIANPVVTYAATGTYSVKLVVNNAGGSDSVTKTNYITVTKTVGINEASNSNIKLYPSPAIDMVYLSIGNIDLGNATIQITSVNGKFNEEVKNSFKQNDVVSIPVNSLQSGIYILTVRTSNDLYKFRFVKQ